uniref:GAR domain-containing protein n=1 Tax=Oncorhynchus tshawytscha TaxID=74940 RepID=A0AAZ3S9W4_ONCTS
MGRASHILPTCQGEITAHSWCYPIYALCSKLSIMLHNKHVMVRVGGGWETFESYLLKHDPCRMLQISRVEGKTSPMSSKDLTQTATWWWQHTTAARSKDGRTPLQQEVKMAAPYFSKK